MLDFSAPHNTKRQYHGVHRALSLQCRRDSPGVRTRSSEKLASEQAGTIRNPIASPNQNLNCSRTFSESTLQREFRRQRPSNSDRGFLRILFNQSESVHSFKCPTSSDIFTTIQCSQQAFLLSLPIISGQIVRLWFRRDGKALVSLRKLDQDLCSGLEDE